MSGVVVTSKSGSFDFLTCIISSAIKQRRDSAPSGMKLSLPAPVTFRSRIKKIMKGLKRHSFWNQVHSPVVDKSKRGRGRNGCTPE